MNELRILLAIAVFMGTALASGVGRTDEREAIWKVFTERQKAAERASVTWTKRFHKSAEAVRLNIEDEAVAAKAAERIGDIHPPPARCALHASGRQCRYEDIGLSFAGEDIGVPYRSIITYDDSGTYWSFSEEAGASQQHSGHIDERDVPPVWDALHIKPLVFALRPLRPEAFGPNPGEWTVEDAPAVIDGRECLVLRGRPPAFGPGGSLYRIFLDVGRDYLPLRYVDAESNSSSLKIQVDIKYDRQEASTWVPSWWKSTVFFGKGRLFEESQNDEVEVELGPTLPAETFRIDFPAGTIVSDGRPGGGMMTVVDDGQLIPRRQVEAEAAAGGTKWWPWLAAAGAAVLGGVLLLWRRRAAE